MHLQCTVMCMKIISYSLKFIGWKYTCYPRSVLFIFQFYFANPFHPDIIVTYCITLDTSISVSFVDQTLHLQIETQVFVSPDTG